MPEKVIIVNTHPVENPEFAGKLADFIASVKRTPIIINGYENNNPPGHYPASIILTGVPIDANYSLTENDTQARVSRSFSWLKDCQSPVLGICYGHQILAHIFGGQVASLNKLVKEEQLNLTWQRDPGSGLFAEVDNLEVFAEHQDYVSQIPSQFQMLCQVNDIPYIMYHKEKDIYGLQFVPEQSDQACLELLERFVSRPDL